jgi:hypothetical protein
LYILDRTPQFSLGGRSAQSFSTPTPKTKVCSRLGE